MIDAGEITDRVRRVQSKIRDRVIEHIARSDSDSLSEVADETAGDTIYRIDRVSEAALIELFESELADAVSFVLIGEGLPDEGVTFPTGISPHEAELRIIVDPIDGTRGLMYDKRSAWVLTGVARNRGSETNLSDIFVAVQSEIPTSKQFRADVIWAVEGEGAHAVGYDRMTGRENPISLRSSRARTLTHGFGMISRFFQGGKDILAQVEESIAEAVIGPIEQGKARLFEDQYICSGGQFYELMAGHDRFNADLRPNLAGVLQRRGQELGICCHPYDVCTELIARELGVIITRPDGKFLDAPLDTVSPVAWVGYANSDLRRAIEPHLRAAMRDFGLDP